jgi:hypothetical protein
MTKPKLSFQSERRYGVELEINAFDGKSRPDNQNKSPEGIDIVGIIVGKHSTDGVDIRGYEHTKDNNTWIIKPDSSCGMEICTPIYKGFGGIKRTCKVVHALHVNPKIQADQRCSVHLHIEVADLTEEQIAKVLGYWLKMESVFLDSMPDDRKCNKYCQPLCKQNLISHEEVLTPRELIRRMGSSKYFSLNCQLLSKGERKTIEFRTGEGAGCKDPWFVKNWVRLLLHFVEMTKDLEPLQPVSNPESPDNPWQGYLILDPKDCFKTLGFDGSFDLSPGLTETRNWFLARLLKNLKNHKARSYCKEEILSLAKEFDVTTDFLVPSDMEKALFDEETKF